MSLTPQTITLDLNPSFTHMQTVYCSQYDDNIRQIVVNMKDGGSDVDVSSYTIYIEGTKPDKKGFSYPLTEIGSVSTHTITFYIQLQMCAVPGMTRVEVVLKSGTDRIGSANFMLAVERAGLQDDTDVSDSELAPYIAGAAQQAQAAANNAADAEAAKDDALQAKDDAIQAKEDAEQSAESISGLSEQITQNTEDLEDLKNDLIALEQQGYPYASIETAVNAWADDHEAQIVNNYVTPQMYGAKGDGQTDDTTAIQAAIDSGKNVYFPKATYVSGQITIDNSNIIIDGGNSTIMFGASYGFYLTEITHDVEIRNFKTVLTYVKDSQATANSHISFAASAENEYYVYNVAIRNCHFDGGVMGISASSVKNLIIADCTFDNFVYQPENSAGGYGALLQSCTNVRVIRCQFALGKYGRHDIYVSVDQRKSNYIQCKNIVIDSCLFDHSELELDASNHYYSDNTLPINIRTSNLVTVSNCYFHAVTGIVALNAEQGNINGGTVANCVVDTPVFNNGSNETKYVINIPPTSYYVTAIIDNVTVINEPNTYQSFASLAKCNVKITNCDIGATRILCANNVTVQIDNITTKITYYLIRFNGTDQTNGYCRDITFLEPTIGQKYYFNTGATVSDGFFVHEYSTKTYTNATYCYRNTELARCGDIVQCSIGILKDLPVGTITTLFTLDVEYRPRKDVVFVLITRDNTKAIIQGWVYANGDVKVYNVNGSASGNLNVNETITYIGAN